MTVPVFTIPTVSLPDVAMLDTSEPLCPSAYPIGRQISYPEIIDESQKYPTFMVPWQDRFNDVTISSTRRSTPVVAKGYFATLNTKTIYDLMDDFLPAAYLYEASDGLYGEGYGDSVLMRKMTTRILSSTSKCSHLGDVYVSPRGEIKAFTLSGLQDVGKVNFTGDWSVPNYDVGVFVTNEKSSYTPSVPRDGVHSGDFWFKTVDGDSSGFFIYKYDPSDGWQKLNENSTDVIRFDKHVEVDFSKLPSFGSASLFEYGTATSSVSSISETVVSDLNFWGMTIARYRGPWTNTINLKFNSVDLPTTFVFDASAMKLASPMVSSSFEGGFTFVMMNQGNPLYYEYEKSTDTSGVSYSFYSGTPLPVEAHGVTYYPPGDLPGGQAKKTSSGRSVPVVTVPFNAAYSGSVDPDGTPECKLALSAVTVTPYRGMSSSYNIPEGWFDPVVVYPGAHRLYYFPGSVSRSSWGQDSSMASIYDNARPTYTSGSGYFSLLSVIFNTDGSEYYKWYDHTPEYIGDDGKPFPDIWVYGQDGQTDDSPYHMRSIYVGLGLKASMTSGIEKTTVIL